MASYNPETKTTARKQTGSFYTPREIVNYMVDESLIAYLKNSVSEASNVPDASSFGKSFQSKDVLGTIEDAMETMFFNPHDEIEIREGNLPHWQQKGVYYHVTFRLADSIPRERVEELKIDRELWKNKYKGKKEFTKKEKIEYNRLFNDRVEGWLNVGYGSCLLKKKENAKIVADALKFFDGKRYSLDEWVVMPNHVHVLVRPFENEDLGKILHSWKSYTANEINKREELSGQLWMHESYDHIVRNEKALNAIRHYIQQNPKVAGISVPEASSVPDASSFGISSVSDASSFRTSQSKDASDTLDSQSKDTLGTFEDALRTLFSYGDINPFEENIEITQEIIKALSTCTILDPACGSGAFPMGILQKMVHILQKLDPDNEIWREVQREKVEKQMLEALDTLDKQAREERLLEINEAFDQSINDSDYARKLFLIENCIYGVDLQPIATQISKLRFFISLVTDQKVNPEKENFGIRPLPNLETKFVAANTLIGIEKENNLFATDDIKDLEKQLKATRSKLFSARTKDTKIKYRKIDEELRTKIAEKLKEKGLPLDSAEKLAKWDPYDQNASSPFFDSEWMFDIKDGFDVVIGNPPYIKEYTDRTVFDGIRNGKYYQGKMDLWYVFACKGIDYLTKNGLLCFIATNNWITNAGASILREKIISETKIEQLLDFGSYMIFESAAIQTMILLARKGNFNNYNIDHRKIQLSSATIEDVKSLLQKYENENYSINEVNFQKEKWLGKTLNFESSEIEFILNQIQEKRNFQLDSKLEVAQGIVPNPDVVNIRNIEKLPNSRIENENIKIGDGVFVVNKGFFDKLPIEEKKYIKPVYEPSSTKRYIIGVNNKEMIYITRKNYKKDCPILINHLSKYKEIMEDRRENQQGRLSFYDLHWPREEYFFTKGPKILSVRKCEKPTFLFTEEEAYVMMAFNVIRTQRINQKYLTAILNSKVVEFWLRYKGKMQGDLFQVDKAPLLEIPIYKADNEKPLVQLTDFVTYQGKQGLETIFYENIVDAFVFNLYFPEHMKERDIDVIEFVEQDITEVMQGREFEKLSDSEKEHVIETLHATWSHPDNEVRNRIKLFAVRSPGILKPILES